MVAGAHAALAAPSGPVYLGVPTDLLRRPAPELPAALSEVAAPAGVRRRRAWTRRVLLIAAAERPLIWAGGGALRAGAGDAVGALAIKLCAPVITTYMGRGLLAPDHPCAVAGPGPRPGGGAAVGRGRRWWSGSGPTSTA